MASGDVVYQHLKCSVDSESVTSEGSTFSFKLVGVQGYNGEITQPDAVEGTISGQWSLGSAYFKSEIVDPLKTYDIIIKEH